MSVAKLRGPRDKKRAKFGKCEGRKSMLERNPYIVQAAKRLAGEKRRSLREIAAELDVQGLSPSPAKHLPLMWLGMLAVQLGRHRTGNSCL
jgi:hypothetical protein